MIPSTIIQWIAAVLQAGGALWVAANIPNSRYGFPTMLAGAVIWTGIAAYQHEWPLAAMSAVFAVINVFGIARWFR